MKLSKWVDGKMKNIFKHRGQLIIIASIITLSAVFAVLLFRLSPSQKPAFERQLFGEWEYKSN